MRYHLHSSNFFHSLSMAHAKLWFIRPWNLERVCAVYIHFWNYFCHYFNFYMNFFIDNSICGTVIWIFAKEKHFAINAQRFRHENRIHSTNIVVRVFFYCFSHSHHHHIISHSRFCVNFFFSFCEFQTIFSPVFVSFTKHTILISPTVVEQKHIVRCFNALRCIHNQINGA